MRDADAYVMRKTLPPVSLFVSGRDLCRSASCRASMSCHGATEVSILCVPDYDFGSGE